MKTRIIFNGREFIAKVSAAQPAAGGLEWVGSAKIRGTRRLVVGLTSEIGRPPLLWQVV